MTVPMDTSVQLQTFKSYLQIIAEPGSTQIEKKLKAAQELSENLETVLLLPLYPQFLQEALRVFVKILQDGEPYFIAELSSQQLRKLLLEIIHRIPANDHLKPYAKAILAVTFRLLEIDNEENVLVCLRIIIELHKQFRPQMSVEVQNFLVLVKKIYKDLADHMTKIFDPKSPVKVKDLTEVNTEAMLTETFAITSIATENKNTENQPITYNLIPKAVLSLKVLAELPIIVVLLYQLYKQQVHNDISDFIPLIMNTITLQPTVQQRSNPAFNKEIFVDFMAAQIKTLSLLAYIIRMYQEVVNAHAQQLVKGVLGLLKLCPQEVAHLRKELLIAARHILATDLRIHFVPVIDNLFDENILIGSGWTAKECLRSSAYSTLADFVHHVRANLNLAHLSMAINLFAKNIHDDSLPISIQTMLCKLLLNLVESIRNKSEEESGNGRELLMRMLEAFVLKFKLIAEVQLPTLLLSAQQQSSQQQLSPSQPEAGGDTSVTQAPPSTPLPTSINTTAPSTPSIDQKQPSFSRESGLLVDKEEKVPRASSQSPTAGSAAAAAAATAASAVGIGATDNRTQANSSYTVADCRVLVKTLVSGVKTITWAVATSRSPTADKVFVQSKLFLPAEELVYVRLVRYALIALDIYTISSNTLGQMQVRPALVQTVRTKEEKEVLEHFAGVFTMMSQQSFKEIFASTIEFLVDRIHANNALQIIANSFLANRSMSATFATILVEYLLERMEEMGNGAERSNLYLKLFKLVFGSVSLLAAENEQMLKPHLHTIVNKSMELALTAKEPYNYFLLLRALFRSIGGGSHDLLYQEFLPLLPSLLQGLNALQSGLHKQHMKDLFVELCLTVPVRLSSLLPYLPMLMDPLVSALNGSQTLISQGLRTLELCVDNLQPDFLYDHIQPVRAELMQALWRCLRNPPDSVAHSAFRVLGKFGGSNRKMLNEPQQLSYNNQESIGPCLNILFPEYKSPVVLSVQKSIDTALGLLKSSATESFYLKQAWQVIKCYLVAAISLEDDKSSLVQLFLHSSFTDLEISSSGTLYKCSDNVLRGVHENALVGMFLAAAIKELRSEGLSFMAGTVRHYTMAAIAQQSGPFPLNADKQLRLQSLDPHILIDALAVIMAYEEKELCKPGKVAMFLILDTATNVLGSKERACQLPLCEYMVEKLCALCYEKAWYAKLGGCMVIKFMVEQMSTRWVLEHQYVFLRALLFVMMDLTGEVSSGALDLAKINLEEMLRLCASVNDPELAAVHSKSMFDVVHELVRQVASPITLVREQCISGLEVIAAEINKTVTEVMEPHKDVLQDMVPPKKHLLRYQALNAQIGLIEANTFCTSLEPRLFTIDLKTVEHKVFFSELLNLCEADDAVLLKLPCYKSVTNLVPFRKSTMRALAACNYIDDKEEREKIFKVLYKWLESSSNLDLQKTAYECLKKFMSGFQIDMEMVHQTMRSMLAKLGDHRSLTVNTIEVLASLTQLFPNSFKEKLCEQLLAHLKKWLEIEASNFLQRAGQVSITGTVRSEELVICRDIINLFCLIPAASTKMIEPLISTVLKAEEDLNTEASSPFRESLIKFLLRYPIDTLDYLLSPNMKEQHARLCEWLVRHKERGRPFREVLEQDLSRIHGLLGDELSVDGVLPFRRHLGIALVHELIAQNPDWLQQPNNIIDKLLNFWISDGYQQFHQNIDSMDYVIWQEPSLLVESLLGYFKYHTNEIELLFHLLRCFISRFMTSFQPVKEYLEETIAKTYPIEWRRQAFFKFVEIFHNQSWSQDLKAKILQLIIIPCFLNSFEKGDGEQLIGGSPSPDQDNPDNVISVFINSIIDPDNPFGMSDAVRILLLQFSSLLVEQAAPHIHDAANKRQGNKLRRLMTFAWPCLLPKNCVDPATKYHGHLLLAHIIAKFAIHKRIVVQVFHSLLKAHAAEAKTVVKQALDILTPAMPLRMEDGHTMLKHWTKKIIIEEHHTVPQLAHILQLIVRHAKIYFPVRHHLIQHMVSSMQRLGFSPNAAFEQRKLAVDLADVIIQWEVQRIHEEQDMSVESSELGLTPPAKRLSTDTAGPADIKKPRHISGQRSLSTDTSQPIDKSYCDDTVNFLLKMACQVTEATASLGSPSELLSRRCVQLLKKVLTPDVWPSVELRLSPWMDKLLLTVEQQQPNFTNICTALELLSFLLVLMKDPLLPSLKPLQRCIAACMLCPNSKVIRCVHSLLSRLINLFPTEPPTSNIYSKHEELESLYSCIGKVVIEGLNNYEKSITTSPSQLFGTLMVLKAACMHNNCYIDRLIVPFMRVLQRMTRDHLSQSVAETNPVATELLILGLDMVKNRVGVMSPDMRKGFIGTILVGLIEKTQDAKVMKAITKMVEDWVKTKTAVALNQSPSLREKAILLAKLMQQLEKRFSDNQELNFQFLELVNYIYRDDTLRGSELTSKLEPAFLSGLRCSQPSLRQKFVEVFDRSIRHRLYDRLLYIVCSQNWESMGTHFWIKQCIELMLTIAVNEHEIQNANPQTLLPSSAGIINTADSHDKAAFSSSCRPRLDTIDSETAENEGEEIDIELANGVGEEATKDTAKKPGANTLRQNLLIVLQRQSKFLESCREVKTIQYLNAVCQLCHANTQLAHDTWLELLPKLWKLLPERSQHHLSGQFGQFLCSGSHVIQKDSHPSALHTFLEAMCQCSPSVPLRPCVLKYLGKTHNLWHRAALVLEQTAFDSGGLNLQLVKTKPSVSLEYDFEQTSASPQQLSNSRRVKTVQELLDALCDLYSLLKEEDLFVGLWQKRSKYNETNIALAYEQHGFFENAQLTFEQAMLKARQDHNQSPATPAVIPEYRLWEEHWIRCSKELNQWDSLLEYANMKGNTNPHLVLECAWRVPNWGLMKDALSQVELSCPREMAWKVNLYRGYIAICHPDDHHLNMIDRLVEVSTTLAVKEWRRLPPILSQCHVPLLQAAQQIMELSEAAQINHGLQPASIGRESSLHDMKATVKTWRNRLPMISDDLSHWSDIFTWRQHHYQFIVNQYESYAQQDAQHQQHSMLGVHASALSIIHFGKIARKHGLTGVCLESLSRIHSIPSVPIVDCFQKIRQQVKCYLQMSGVMGKQELQEGLEVIESTNLKYFTKEMTAEFYALKGLFLAQIGRSEDANKAFSAAVQMHDTLVKAWALWGDYLEGIFTKDRMLATGVSAITCYLHACRHQNESKSRKYLAKVIWLLTYDDDKCTLAEAVDKYNVGVPPLQWLPWIPQLLTCLVRPEGRLILNLLSTVGRVYPQAVYFPLRTLYLTLKIEQRERHRETRQQSIDGRLVGDMPSEVIGSSTSGNQDSDPAMSVSNQNISTAQESIGQPAVCTVKAPITTQASQEGQSTSDGGPIKATPPMWRCSRIMQMQRDLHPTILLSLEGIVDNMVWFRENWYEEVLRQLRQALAKCYAIAFENRGAVTEATITPSTLNFVRKLVSTFGVGIENVSGMATAFSSAASESLARRAQASAQDPVFQKMKSQFTADFDFNIPGLKKLHNLISKLKKWIKILEAKIKLLPKSFYIEEKCRFMSNFCQSTAEIELPGESLLPKHNHYFIHIARFLPKMEIVQKHNTSARRLYIRGHNGKVYPYLVMNDGCLTESRREERVLQLFRMMNHLLGKQKETCHRLLQYSVPRVVAVSPQMRLVEDNPAAISLLDIYKQCCSKRNQEHDAPIARYYERLATVQARGSQISHQVLRDILKEVQANIVPRGLLKEWAVHTFPNATDYWTFRKNFTASLALEGVAEIVLHLTRLNPDMMYVHQDAGFVNVAYFKFDIDEQTGDLDAKRPVPIRLTPNIAEFLTTTGVTGSLTAAMVASARCFVLPHYKFPSYLKAMLRDEFITWHKKKQDEDNPTAQPSDMDSEQLITLVNKAIAVISTTLQNLATFEGAESRVNTLVAAANSHDNLCRMDPAWHPWL